MADASKVTLGFKVQSYEPGRDEIAVAAMQGLLAYSHFSRGRDFATGVAQCAYEMADAMLAERAKGKP